jgi:hypothetical protein
MDEPEMAKQLAFLGMRRAEADFGIRRYGEKIAALVGELVPEQGIARVVPRARVAQT